MTSDEVLHEVSRKLKSLDELIPVAEAMYETLLALAECQEGVAAKRALKLNLFSWNRTIERVRDDDSKDGYGGRPQVR